MCIPPYVRRLLALTLVLAAACPVWGQGDFDFGSIDLGGFGEEPAEPVALEAQFTPATGDRPAVLMLAAEIEPGWHVYSTTQPKGGPMRTNIRLEESEQYRPLGNWQSHPRPKSRVDTVVWNGLTIEEHDEQVTWYLPIELRDGADPANLTIRGRVSLQACKESCIPLKFDFAARLGDGVTIGDIETTEQVSVATTSPNEFSRQAPTDVLPPAAAGVYRAEGSQVTWYGWLENSIVAPGGRTKLLLRAEMPPRWHVNAYAANAAGAGNQPTLIALQPIDGLSSYRPQTQANVVERPSPVQGFGQLRYHEGEVVWEIPIDVSPQAPSGPYVVEGLLGYQACEANEQGLGSCELSKGAKFTATLNVSGQASAEPSTVAFEPANYADAEKLANITADSLQEAGLPGSHLQVIEFAGSSSNAGLLGMLGAALIGGLILNLMPCVLPVIGLKIMAFAKQGGESRTRVFTLNLAYVAGLMAVFLLLATLASLPQWGLSSYGFDWGELNTQTWFKVSMTALVFAMALSFLGLWEIPLPGFTGSSTAAEMASREGYGGAFFKGVLTTILATPCSGPFLGPVFGYTIGQPMQVTYLIFLFVGLGMSLPYLLVGAFPALIRWVPKPGMWMETFKQLLAFVLLATVVYLLSTINAEHFIPTMALLVALWFACWLGGRQPITASPARRYGSWLTGVVTAAFVGVVAFAPDPPPAESAELPWKAYSPAQLATAQASGKTVLVDFTADWCLTCQWNLVSAIDVPLVKKVVDANGVETLKADWTDEDEDIKQTLEQLRSRSIPLLAIYPANRPNVVIVLRDTVTQEQVLQALAQAGAKKANPERGDGRGDRASRLVSNQGLAEAR